MFTHVLIVSAPRDEGLNGIARSGDILSVEVFCTLACMWLTCRPVLVRQPHCRERLVLQYLDQLAEASAQKTWVPCIHIISHHLFGPPLQLYLLLFVSKFSVLR